MKLYKNIPLSTPFLLGSTSISPAHCGPGEQSMGSVHHILFLVLLPPERDSSLHFSSASAWGPPPTGHIPPQTPVMSVHPISCSFTSSGSAWVLSVGYRPLGTSAVQALLSVTQRSCQQLVPAWASHCTSTCFGMRSSRRCKWICSTMDPHGEQADSLPHCGVH